ncbi:MAG: L,D-transpeptidase family protein [Terrimicrobiaceae bacterium]
MIGHAQCAFSIFLRIVVGILVIGLLPSPALAQSREAPTLKPKKAQKKAGELISKQAPPKVIPRVLERATPENVSVYVSLEKQRAYLTVGEETAIDSPISSGKRAGMTPKGSFTILEKSADHRSSIYGDFVSRKTGAVVRGGVSTKIDSAPSGTVYRGAPMKWFMRMNWQGVGMHTGKLPGYPASHGCIRLPEDIAKMFYDRVKLGTPVVVGD